MTLLYYHEDPIVKNNKILSLYFNYGKYVFIISVIVYIVLMILTKSNNFSTSLLSINLIMLLAITFPSLLSHISKYL